MISKSTIDKVYESARVEEVIGDFVLLKRAGANLKGLSPFSDERSPSFMVSPVKGIWKDFSSGKGGNAIAFVMEHEKFSYPEAIRYLAKKYNIEIEETEQTAEEKANNDVRESLFLVSEFANKFFQNTLLNTEEGVAIGLSYFKERGFTNETIKKFQLGYSPETWDAFTKEALGQGFKLEFLETVGLTIPKEGGNPFDRFKGRVMFPIQSMSGRTLGFGGRILTNDKKAAKYLNSPASDLYDKSKVLYGIFHAKQAIAKQDNCFLVEGYTDVIQLHQAGIENVVSSSGTALTPDQIRLINRLTKNITVLFDGDAAGLRASIRGIDLILEEGMNVRVCSFPDGDDPDSFAKKTPFEDLVKYLDDNAKDFIQFKASILMQDAKNDPIKKAELIREMVVSISKIPDRIKREIYIQECSRIMDISEQVLMNTLAQIIQKNHSDSEKKLKTGQAVFEVITEEPQTSNHNLDFIHNLEKSILEILLLYGNEEVEFENIYIKFDENQNEKTVVEKIQSQIFQRIYLNLQEDEVEFSNPVFKEIYNDLVAQYLTNEVFDTNAYSNTVKPEYSHIISDILMNDEKYQLHGWLDKKQVFVKDKKNDAVLQRLVTENIMTYREYLINKLNQDLVQNALSQPDTNMNEVMETINEYNKLKVSITRSMGRMRSN
jgi:DNA primase